jgi:hypothetical protein
MRLLCIVVALAACRPADHPAESRPAEIVVVPRSHQIPPGHTAEVRKLFESHVISFPVSVVSSAGTNTQFVNPSPSFIGGDRFVIAATPEIHAELDTLLAAMAKQPASPAPTTYNVTYWAIEADPSTETQLAPDLAELEPVLKSLGALGPRKFKTIDRAATRSLDGARAEIKSHLMYVESTLSIDSDALQLQLQLQLHPDDAQHSKVETKLQLAPDKPIVLGETAMGSGSDATGADLVLYVVRAQRAE